MFTRIIFFSEEWFKMMETLPSSKSYKIHGTFYLIIIYVYAYVWEIVGEQVRAKESF